MLDKRRRIGSRENRKAIAFKTLIKRNGDKTEVLSPSSKLTLSRQI